MDNGSRSRRRSAHHRSTFRSSSPTPGPTPLAYNDLEEACSPMGKQLGGRVERVESRRTQEAGLAGGGRASQRNETGSWVPPRGVAAHPHLPASRSSAPERHRPPSPAALPLTCPIRQNDGDPRGAAFVRFRTPPRSPPTPVGVPTRPKKGAGGWLGPIRGAGGTVFRNPAFILARDWILPRRRTCRVHERLTGDGATPHGRRVPCIGKERG